MIKIVIADDHEIYRDGLKMVLKKEKSFSVIGEAKNGKQLLDIVYQESPDVIITDIVMPEMDGIDTCREIRDIANLKDVMIAFLSARNEDYSQIAGFEVGADDYITKPIKPRVFISRIKALLRRYAPEQQKSTQVDLGGIKIDKEKYCVYKDDVEIAFPKKEFKLLSLLASKPGKVFTREFILEQVWGDEVVVGDRTIDVHIRKLREKLGDDYIKTIKGIGYKFEF